MLSLFPARLSQTCVLSASLAFAGLVSASAETFVSSASAQAAAAQPATRYFRGKYDEVTRVLRRAVSTDAERQRRSQEVTRILNDLLDYDELSRRALGNHWDQHTPAERQEFTSLLRQLVERNFQGSLERVFDFEIRYTREVANAQGTTVFTEARSREQRRQPPVEISYTMRGEGGNYRVVDVTTDGVSLVRNYQTQFNRIISQSGWAELIRRMQQRLANNQPE